MSLGWGVCLFRELLSLDDGLDNLLLMAARFIVSPPSGSLVFTAKTEMLTSTASYGAFITLLSS